MPEERGQPPRALLNSITLLLSAAPDPEVTRESARNKFVEGFADGYVLMEGTRHRDWDLYTEWLEGAMMAENIRYWMEAAGYGGICRWDVCTRRRISSSAQKRYAFGRRKP
jgi:hypothetical protein